MQEHGDSGMYFDVQPSGEFIIRGKLGPGESPATLAERLERLSHAVFQEREVKRMLEAQGAGRLQLVPEPPQKPLLEKPELQNILAGLSEVKPLEGRDTLQPQKNYSRKPGQARGKTKAAPGGSHCA